MRQFLILIFLLIGLNANAQFGLRVYHEMPLKGAPIYLDNSFGAEIVISLPLENEQFVTRASLTYLPYKLRYDTIPTYLAPDPDWGSPLKSGYTINVSYVEFTGGGGVDFIISDKGPFRPFIGANITAGYAELRFTEHVETEYYKETNEIFMVLGARLTAGLSVEMDSRLEAFVDGNFGWKTLMGEEGYSVGQLGMGVRYWIFDYL